MCIYIFIYIYIYIIRCMYIYIYILDVFWIITMSWQSCPKQAILVFGELPNGFWHCLVDMGFGALTHSYIGWIVGKMRWYHMQTPPAPCQLFQSKASWCPGRPGRCDIIEHGKGSSSVWKWISHQTPIMSGWMIATHWDPRFEAWWVQGQLSQNGRESIQVWEWSSFTQGIWGLPKIGVPPVIIHFSGIFPYKPTILGYPHSRKPPYRCYNDDISRVTWWTLQPCSITTGIPLVVACPWRG